MKHRNQQLIVVATATATPAAMSSAGRFRRMGGRPSPNGEGGEDFLQLLARFRVVGQRFIRHLLPDFVALALFSLS